MRGPKSLRLGAVSGGLICLAAMLPGCEKPVERTEKIRPAKTMVVRAADTAQTRSYPALIEPVQQVDLSFDVAGPLAKLAVQERDAVSAGDLIGQIRLRDFDIAVRRAQSNLQQSRAELAKMKAGARPEDILRLEAALRSAKVSLDTKEKNLGRIKTAFSKQVASQQELDTAQEARDTAKESVRQATEELNIGKAGARTEDIAAQEAQIEGLQAELARADADKADATLKAPFTGVITRKLVDQFQSVQAKQPIVRLVAEEVEARVDVPEQDVLKRRQSKAKLKVLIRSREGKGLVYPAEFKKWSPEADPETGTFAVFLSVTIPEQDKKNVRLLSGMSATVEATFAPETRPTTPAASIACRVPLSAVFSPKEGLSCVWVVQPEALTLSRRTVLLGEQVDGAVWVVDGLKDGEEILTAGVHFVRDGQTIRRTGADKEAKS